MVVGSSREGGHHRPVDDATFAELGTLGSWLRTTLTYDVGSRQHVSLAPEWLAERWGPED